MVYYVVNANIDRGYKKLNRYEYNVLRGFLWNNWLQIKTFSFPRFPWMTYYLIFLIKLNYFIGVNIPQTVFDLLPIFFVQFFLGNC